MWVRREAMQVLGARGTGKICVPAAQFVIINSKKNSLLEKEYH